VQQYVNAELARTIQRDRARRAKPAARREIRADRPPPLRWRKALARRIARA
jgi:hypothetical protein